MTSPATSPKPAANWKDVEAPIPGRRTWKRSKERTETIWPPFLESALLEALERYRPANSRRVPRQLRRFPKRNRFISDHIFLVTGARRTAKQVGSRLQQMRDTCNDKRILNLVFGREYPSEGFGPDSSLPAELTPSTTTSTPVSWTSEVAEAFSDASSAGPAESLPPSTRVTIELVRPPHQTIFTPAIAKSFRTNHQRISLEYPFEIENSGPVLTFSTPRKISTENHYSHFRVLAKGDLAHSESTPLIFLSSAIPGCHLYSTELIPQLWAHLCQTAHLFQCVIQQDIVRTNVAFEVVPVSPSSEDHSIRSVTYEFSCSPPMPPVFRPPSLGSEPLLPPGFPRVSYSPRSLAPAVEHPTIPALSPGSMGSSSNYESSAYYYTENRVEVTDGMFSGTSFHHTGEIPAMASFYDESGFYSFGSHTGDRCRHDSSRQTNNTSPSTSSYFTV